MSKRIDRFKEAGLIGCLNGKMNMESWIEFKKQPPAIGDFIVAYREPFPTFYWMGTYKGVPNEQDEMFTHWLSLPRPSAIDQIRKNEPFGFTENDL